ncbi:Trimethylamine N-oxide reductase I cytochrome c-type subunit [Paramixta manurensis]|uniref:Cytochrome c-type protein n=1 Tax=Paramixta manurensis TaxID=2740817 RepID=A0A6M8UDW4_9GAMM|nr:Trimethylamine N-oxide reductase I cytochrome c-type subunit [Erwiniaceae bacterium PD-1]
MKKITPSGRARSGWKWKGIGIISAGIVIGMLVLAGGFTVMHKTSDTAFCVACHSMERPLAEYQGSIHFQNHAGIRAECADCHVPNQPLAYLLTKVGALKDVYGEVTGKIDTPEKYNAHKLAMAESVWKTMKENDSATCRSCHSFDAMDILAQRTEARQQHPVAIREGQTCIDCHRGVAHILPDMSASNSAGANKLAAAAAQTSPAAKALYAIKTQPFSLNAEQDTPAGTLLPSTRVEVVQRSGEVIQGRINGWQQEGVNNVIYAAPGKRIISALVDEHAVASIHTSGTQTDSETGLVWHQVALDISLNAKSLVQDQQQIWQYAAGLMTANCTGCHGLTALKHYNANQWIGVIKGMAPRTSLDQEQLRLLTQYAQKHASDMATSENGALEGEAP